MGAPVSRALRLPSFAKINLGLEVLHRRRDGYHELRTVFQTIDLHDDIVLRECSRGVVLRCAHPEVPEDCTNLAARAAQALRRHAGIASGVLIEIEKRVPVARGLGGGQGGARRQRLPEGRGQLRPGLKGPVHRLPPGQAVRTVHEGRGAEGLGRVGQQRRS